MPATVLVVMKPWQTFATKREGGGREPTVSNKVVVFALKTDGF